MLPITEQRLSIPYFMLYENFPWYESIAISFIGNLFIGITVHLILVPIMIHLRKVIFLGALIKNILNRVDRKMFKIKNKNKYLGLIFFIGIPLPFTGVWTGAVGAYILCLSKKHTFLCMLVGLSLSAFIVGVLTFIGNDLWIMFIKNAINKKLGFE